jgi:ergothioneine biosynthesis protein EgtB
MTPEHAAVNRPQAPRDVAYAYRDARCTTTSLVEGLSAEDCQVQSMPDASPAKWHLAHTTWFFETFVLGPADAGYTCFHPQFGYLFNSYYEAIGERHPRPLRGLLTRPTLAQVLDYRAHVDAAIGRHLTAGTLGPELVTLVELGIHHEQQHQELLLTDLKHAFSCNPLLPAYGKPPAALGVAASTPASFSEFEGGLQLIGAGREGFAFDNEGPRHQVLLQPFEIADAAVTNGQYLEFVRAGGYGRADFWLSDGWAEVTARQLTSPLYWREHDGEVAEFTLGGVVPLDLGAPACHLSYYEADAYATWAGCRLPTELEWEVAATAAAGGQRGQWLESGRLHPGREAPGGESGRHFLGDVWEWTRSAYGPYPGYQRVGGALGEYNGKFMCGQLVLRGGSCATPADHARETYRNFFPPGAAWQFSGVRLARDV